MLTRDMHVAAFALAAIVLAPTAEAAGDDESWDIWEMRQILEYEWKRAREYKATPEAERTEWDIKPPITSYHDIPGNEAPLVNRREEKP